MNQGSIDTLCNSGSLQSVGSNYTAYPYYPSQYYYTWIPPIDYDLLADKIVERIKGTKERSIDECRKEINRLLDEIEKKK